MDIYSRLSKTSSRLLGKYGRTVKLRRYSVGGGDYNPSSGSAAPEGVDGSVEETRNVVLTDAPGKRVGSQYGQTLEPGTLIQDNDKWVYMDADGSAPCVSDHILLDGTLFTIIDVQVTSPGNTALMYLLVLRA